jgi:hypothetical protein
MMSVASPCPRRSTAEALDVADIGRQDSCFQLGTGGKAMLDGMHCHFQQLAGLAASD